MNEQTEETIGYIVGGSLRDGLYVRLSVSPEKVKEGSFVVTDSGNWRFYGLITNLALGATNPRFADERPSRIESAFIRRALMGKTLYTTLEMYTTLMMDISQLTRLEDWDNAAGLQPVKTVPAHHVPVRLAREEDVEAIFGKEKPGSFVIGYTLEQGYPVRLDLKKFVQRSSGIFGATGTGKSFLTRMALAGLMREGAASALVFDMHNEYAFD
ncbi:MAG TPA: DUF87 domain-containing protein, partial [Anaerolineae bacterium]|nr:DUF87 domain-containing protein [Anaerolineae bacterium]